MLPPGRGWGFRGCFMAWDWEQELLNSSAAVFKADGTAL